MKSPHVRRLRLAKELRALRKAADLTAEKLAKHVRISRVALTHLETAARRPDIGDVMNLLEALDVSESKFSTLVRVARDATERGWWEDPQFRLMGDRQMLYADLEAGASTIREYQPAFISGLLQTEEYIRARNRVAMRSASGTWDPEIATAARLERQAVFNREDGPTLDIIAEEIAVARVTAPSRIMIEQLQHLIDVCASHPRVTLRVLPINIDVTDAMVPRTMFSIYNYPDRLDPAVISVEAVHKDLILTEDQEVASYESLWELLDRSALSQDKSIDVLRRTIKWLRS